MISEELRPAKLIRRYKRFLADVRMADGSEICVHCPNPGSMLGLAEPGSLVYLRDSTNGKRKLRYTWVLSVVPGALVNVDTLLANKIVFDALNCGELEGFSSYKKVQKERSFGKSRFDFFLSGGTDKDCFLEVKSTTLVEEETAMFPDAKTERGRKHLDELILAHQSGFRAVQLFLIGRSDSRQFRPADHIDALYGERLRYAAKHGVDAMAFKVCIDQQPSIDGEGQVFSYRLGEAVPLNLFKT